MPIATSKLASFIAKPPGAAERLVLCHEGLGGQAILLSLALLEVRESDAMATAGAVLDAAQAHSDASGLSTSFALRWEDSDGRPLRTVMTRHKPEREDEDTAAPSDPTMQGVVAVMVRHNEAITRLLLGSQSQIALAYQAILKLQSEEIVALRRRVRSAEEKGGEVSQVDELEAVSRAEAWSKLTDLAPVLLEKFLEKKVTH